MPCEECGGGFHVRRVETSDGPMDLCFDCREEREQVLRGPR